MSLKKKLLAEVIPVAALCLFAPITVARAEADAGIYKVDGAYQVKIPAAVTVDPSMDTGTLNISGTLNACHNLEITITSNNQYHLANDSDNDRKISYKISDDKVVFSNKDGSNAINLNYDVDVRVTETPVVSGTYTDLLRFELNAKDYTPEKKKHQLIFDGNGSEAGDVSISTGYKYVVENAPYGMLPTPKRKGYTFLGWFTDAAGGNKVSETDIMGMQDTTIYAHWKANVLTLHYHSGGAQERLYYGAADYTPLTEKDVVENETVAYDARYQHYDWGLLNVSRLKKAGYHPDGADGSWRVGSPESEFVVSAQTPIESPYTGAKVAEYLGVISELEAGNVTVELYPVFYPNEYTVKYEANATGATGTTEPTKHTYDTESALAKNGFTRPGYTFECWVKVNSETDKPTFPEGAVISNLTAKNNETITLYARWKKNTSSDEPADGEEVNNAPNLSDALAREDSTTEKSTKKDTAQESDSQENTSTKSPESTEPEQQTTEPAGSQKTEPPTTEPEGTVKSDRSPEEPAENKETEPPTAEPEGTLEPAQPETESGESPQADLPEPKAAKSPESEPPATESAAQKALAGE